MLCDWGKPGCCLDRHLRHLRFLPSGQHRYMCLHTAPDWLLLTATVVPQQMCWVLCTTVLLSTLLSLAAVQASV